MQVFGVSSHHRIFAQPLEHQGVLLKPKLLEEGFWWPAGGGGTKHVDRVTDESEFRRSENEPEYKAALEALFELRFGTDNKYLAVVSIYWHPEHQFLVLGKRAWLSIFYRGGEIVSYSHKGDRPFRSFIEAMERPELDKDAWARRFRNDILAYWREVRLEGCRMGRNAKKGLRMKALADRAIGAFV